jgi:hypothetical protein
MRGKIKKQKESGENFFQEVFPTLTFLIGDVPKVESLMNETRFFFFFLYKLTFSIPFEGNGGNHRKRCRTDEVAQSQMEIRHELSWRMLRIRHLIRLAVTRHLLLKEKAF